MSYFFTESTLIRLPDFTKADSVIAESMNGSKVYLIEVAAIHEGLTANYNMYTRAELEKSLPSWVKPYPKPIILNHDLQNSEALGRIIAAKMDEESDGTPFIRLQLAISDPQAIEKVKTKRYLTGSVGGFADKVICSISGENLVEKAKAAKGPVVKFKKGNVYNGKLAYWTHENITFKEYSFVNSPADSKSIVRKSSDNQDWTVNAEGFILDLDATEIYSTSQQAFLSESLDKSKFIPIYCNLRDSISILNTLECNNSYGTLLSEKEITLIDEETNIMAEPESEKDIIDIVDSLNEDLSSIAATSTPKTEDIEGDSTQEDDTEISVDSEENLSLEEESDSDQESEKIDSSDNEESVEEDNSESTETSTQDEASEDSSTEQELTQEKGSAESEQDLDEEKQAVTDDRLASLEAVIEALTQENVKLKMAIHKQLADRVVDTKIALGFEDIKDRETLLTEHVNRTAQSLADSLRDLAKYPSKSNKVVSNIEQVINPILGTESGSNSVIDLNSDNTESESVKEEPDDNFVKFFTDVLMKRRPNF